MTRIYIDLGLATMTAVFGVNALLRNSPRMAAFQFVAAVYFTIRAAGREI